MLLILESFLLPQKYTSYFFSEQILPYLLTTKVKAIIVGNLWKRHQQALTYFKNHDWTIKNIIGKPHHDLTTFVGYIPLRIWLAWKKYQNKNKGLSKITSEHVRNDLNMHLPQEQEMYIWNFFEWKVLHASFKIQLTLKR